MSLLILNSSSRIARGLAKGFLKEGSFDRILCADLFPNYKAIERFISLTTEVDPNQASKLHDLKITGKQSVSDAIREADQVIYVTHDYFQNVPAKTSYFENVMKTMSTEFPDKKVVKYLNRSFL